jgi:hypothetical protein
MTNSTSYLPTMAPNVHYRSNKNCPLRSVAIHMNPVQHTGPLVAQSLHITMLFLSRYSNTLRVGRSRDRNPVEARFSAPVKTGPWGPSNLLYNGYRLSFPVVKRPGRGVNHPPLPSSAEVKERVDIYLHTRLGLLGLL